MAAALSCAVLTLCVSCGFDTFPYIPEIDETKIKGEGQLERSFSYQLDSSSYRAFRGFLLYYKIYPGSLNIIDLETKIEADRAIVSNNASSALANNQIMKFGTYNTETSSSIEDEFYRLSIALFTDESGGSFSITEDSEFRLTFTLSSGTDKSVHEKSPALTVTLLDVNESVTSLPVELYRIIPDSVDPSLNTVANFAFINISRAPDIASSTLQYIRETPDAQLYIVLFVLPYGLGESYSPVYAEEASYLPSSVYTEKYEFNLFSD